MSMLFKNMFKGIVLPIIVIMIASLLRITGLALEIIVIAAFLVFFIFLLTLLFPTEPKKNRFKKNISLYQWMDDLTDFDEYLMYSLKNYNIKYSTIDNLTHIKNMIMKITNKKISTLKMYRAFYDQQLKESGENVYLKTIIVSLIPIVTLIFSDSIFEINQFSTRLMLLIFIFVTIAAIGMKFGSNKKRTGLIIAIISLCIEEIEEETGKKAR